MALTVDLLPLSAPWVTTEDVLSGLTALEASFVSQRDKRGIFTTAYALMTAGLAERIEQGEFEDPDWLRLYLPAFADLYRRALLDYETDPESAPKPWRIAFDAARADSLLIQDVFLGINAHVNHDLPLALMAVTIDPERESRYRDHVKVNDTLRHATGPVQGRIRDLYAPGLGLLDIAAGEFDEIVTNFSLEKAREAAWWGGVSLVDAEDETVRDRRVGEIADRSAVLARLILAPSEQFPLLFPALRWLERLGPDWPEIIAEAEPAIHPGDAMLDDTEPVVASVDEVVARLHTLIAELDVERSRLAIYPTVYLEVTRRLQEALAEGVFEEPDWVENLDLHFASQYFRTIQAFRDGRRSDLPLCWQTALDEITGDMTLVVQDLVLSVNARLYHDLGIALWMAGLFEIDPERRTRDFKKVHDVFKASIDPVGRILADKYSPLIRLGDVVGGSLDERAVDTLYVRARDRAIENAKALAEADSIDTRRAIRWQMDLESNLQAEKILLRDLVGGEMLIGLLRRFEEGHEEPWSSYLEPLPLYRRVMGEEFDRLPPVLRQFHGSLTDRRASGTVRVSRGGGALGRRFGGLVGLPESDESVPIRLEVRAEGRKERWVRWFGDDEGTETRQWEDDGLLVDEAFPFRFRFELITDGNSLEFRQRDVRLLALLPFPDIVSPHIHAKMTARDDGWDIRISVRVPLFGRVIEYDGFVTPVV